MASIYDPIPNSPFSSQKTYSIDSPLGGLIVGSGLAVDQYGNLIAASNAGGTVTSITFGTGFFDPPQTITVTGSVNLLPASATRLGGVKAGANVTIAPDGTISVAPPGIGTITAVIAGSGLNGGAIAGAATLSLSPATTSTLGGVVVGNGLNVSGGSISVKQATPSALGGATLATSAEVISGTDAQKIVTPQTLASKVASTTAQGLVQLSDAVTVPNSTVAATQTAAYQANSAAVAAQTTANAALPKAGGVMTGVITFAAGQTFPGVAFPIATTNSLGVISVGPGLEVNSSGVLSTKNNGTVTAITAGPGLGTPGSGDTISTFGTIRLLPPTTDGLQLGGVRAGDNISITASGVISVPGENFIASNNPYAYNSYIWPAPNPPGPSIPPAPPCPGANGQVLTMVDQVTGTVGWTNAGTLQSVTSPVGSGITVTSTPTTATVSLTPAAALVPGDYGATALIPFLHVNEYGQITSAGVANPYSPYQIATTQAPPVLELNFAFNNLHWEWIMQGPMVVADPVNAESGQSGYLLIQQNSITPYTINWGAAWNFENGLPYGGNPTLSGVDLVAFTVVRPNYIVVTKVVENIG
jgi:hypothetical protein